MSFLLGIFKTRQTKDDAADCLIDIIFLSMSIATDNISVADH